MSDYKQTISIFSEKDFEKITQHVLDTFSQYLIKYEASKHNTGKVLYVVYRAGVYDLEVGARCDEDNISLFVFVKNVTVTDKSKRYEIGQVDCDHNCFNALKLDEVIHRAIGFCSGILETQP